MSNLTDQDSDDQASGTTTRRGALAALGGGAVLGGVAGAITGRANGGWRRDAFELDVSILGGTFRYSAPVNPADDADFRVPFLIEGWIYPPGTVGDGFIPTADNQIGRWFCQGWQILDGERPEPHTTSRQTFTFGGLVAGDLFPETTLLTAGLEGTLDESQIATRAVVGGTGTYLAALGACRQTHKGTNTTVFADGTGDPAPNLSMNFELVMPDL